MRCQLVIVLLRFYENYRAQNLLDQLLLVGMVHINKNECLWSTVHTCDGGYAMGAIGVLSSTADCIKICNINVL